MIKQIIKKRNKFLLFFFIFIIISYLSLFFILNDYSFSFQQSELTLLEYLLFFFILFPISKEMIWRFNFKQANLVGEIGQYTLLKLKQRLLYLITPHGFAQSINPYNLVSFELKKDRILAITVYYYEINFRPLYFRVEEKFYYISHEDSDEEMLNLFQQDLSRVKDYPKNKFFQLLYSHPNIVIILVVVMVTLISVKL